MDQKMAVHDDERGDSWKTCEEGYLYDRLMDEIEELKKKCPTPRIFGIPQKARDEFLDIANFCMMLYNRLDNGGNQQ